MNREEFMKELESLLYDIPSEEREEALQYYNGYFEDAGADHEDEIIKELGSPERVAAIIKSDLNANAEDIENRGYFTEKGYQDPAHDEKFELMKQSKSKDQNESNGQRNSSDKNGYNNAQNANNNGGANFGSSNNQNYGNGSNGNNFSSNGNGSYGQNNSASRQNNNNSNTGLIILIIILTLPITLPIISTIFGVVVAIIAVLFALGIAGVCMMGAGVALVVAGIIKLGIPFLGLAISGGGLIVFGLGMLFVFISVWLCKVVVPAMIRGIVSLCRLPFKNRSVTA